MGRAGRGDLIRPAVTEETRALVLLRVLPRIGDRTAVRLLRAQGSARGVLALSAEAFRRAAGRNAERARRDPAVEKRAEWVLARCSELGIRIVGFDEPGYPGSLKVLSDPPPVLFMRGRASLPTGPAVAVVGSRRATPVGRRAAERIALALSRSGVTVVSGMALGIDGAAHRGGLAGPGGTVAVLGSGPDRPYPSGNRRLFERILAEGLIVSEFPPGEGARAYHFPRRNRILAALSRAVVVVEAARRSGALITVDHALDLGLEVFAVPGSVEAPQAEGTNALLRDGAHLLTNADELMEVMGWEPCTAPRSPRSEGAPSETDGRRGAPAPSDSDAGRVMRSLGPAPAALDGIVSAAGLPPARTLAVLTRLELDGAVHRTREGWRLRENG